MIDVEGLVKRYGPESPPAVAGLDLTVSAGEVYALLGRNGSGKSTTVGVLATLLLPTAGRARVAGLDVVDRPAEVRRRIGVTLQEAGVDPEATGVELLTLHGRLLGLPARGAAARALDLLERFELAGAGERKVRTYSGGMRRRLDLATALIGRPEVVFLDEPTTALDPISRQALWDEVRALRDDGVTVLLTTQYLDEADRLADRVGILAEGRLAVEGTPAELKRAAGVATLDDVFLAAVGERFAPAEAVAA
jgi:ABC-type multidrug transport system ATPase subunit